MQTGSNVDNLYSTTTIYWNYMAAVQLVFMRIHIPGIIDAS